MFEKQTEKALKKEGRGITRDPRLRDKTRRNKPSDNTLI